jgi:hypothetical protein
MHVSPENLKRYGFTRNPNHPLWKNKKDALKTMDLRLVERQPSNATFHNLKGKELPCGSEQLLGLSLKFCIQENIPTPQVNKILTKLRRAVRLCAWLHSKDIAENEEDNNESIPGFYLPSTWLPPLDPPRIENGVAAFGGKLDDHFEHHKPDCEDSLIFHQRQAMKKFKNDPSIHICDTDKNLGPAAIGKQVYLKQDYEEHLVMMISRYPDGIELPTKSGRRIAVRTQT